MDYRNKMDKLSLVTFTSIPHHSAESIHMVMTAMELSKLCDFQLISSAKIWRKETFSKDLSLYDVDSSRINYKKILQLYPDDTLFLKFFTRRKNDAIYCRQCVVAKEFLNKNIPVILELHSLPSSKDIPFLKAAFNNKNFVGLIVITESLKIDILDLLNLDNNELVYVLPDAADIDRFHYNEGNGITSNLKVGYIGSNYPGKGWEVIQELPKICNSEFHIYGFSQENNPYSNMILNGKIPFAQIPNALNTFDIGLLPNQPSVVVANQSEIGKYTSPMKLFEYMASGKVIIASDIPVIKEILTDNVNALLVPHDNPVLWKEAIERLNKDPELYLRIQRQAYNDVCENYSYKARAKRILSILDNWRLIS